MSATTDDYEFRAALRDYDSVATTKSTMLANPKALCHQRRGSTSAPKLVTDPDLRASWPRTPIVAALLRATETDTFRLPSNEVQLLKLSLLLCPEGVAGGTTCRHLTEHMLLKHPDTGLVEALVEECPWVLCLPKVTKYDGQGVPVMQLLHEVDHYSNLIQHVRRRRTDYFTCIPVQPRRDLEAFSREHTIEMTLAVVEHHMRGNGSREARRDVKAFQGRVREAVAAALSSDVKSSSLSSSTSDLMNALRKLTEEQQLQLCASIFKHPETADKLHRDAKFRRDVLKGPPVALYRRRRGRSADPSLDRQVRVLDLVNDSVDCLYHQIRGPGLQLILKAARSASFSGHPYVPSPTTARSKTLSHGMPSALDAEAQLLRLQDENQKLRGVKERQAKKVQALRDANERQAKKMQALRDANERQAKEMQALREANQRITAERDAALRELETKNARLQEGQEIMQATIDRLRGTVFPLD